MLLAHRK
jgi:hypothetical protein